MSTTVRKTACGITAVERTIEEIRNMRFQWDLSHIIFAFPQIKTDTGEEWTDPSAHVAGCLGAAERSQHPSDKNLPYTVRGISQIELDVTKPNIKRLMNIGVFTIVRHKSGFRIILPPEVREIHGKSTIAIVGVPPFHTGATAKMEIILQMQRTCQKISEELFHIDKWRILPKNRIKELRSKKSIGRRDAEDTRSLLWMEQNRRCAACGKKINISEATLEHELPKAMHGPNVLANLSVTCFKCNQDKGNSLPLQLKTDDQRWSNYVPMKGLFIPRH